MTWERARRASRRRSTTTTTMTGGRMVCERPRGGWTAWVVPLVPTPYCTCICACAHLDACLARSMKVSGLSRLRFWECPIHCIMLTTYVTSLSGHVDVPVVCRPGFRGGVYAHRTRLRAGDSTQTAPGRLNSLIRYRGLARTRPPRSTRRFGPRWRPAPAQFNDRICVFVMIFDRRMRIIYDR